MAFWPTPVRIWNVWCYHWLKPAGTGNEIISEVTRVCSLPPQMSPSGCRVKPSLHSHTKLPNVLLHTSWQFPLSTSHSSISANQKETHKNHVCLRHDRFKTQNLTEVDTELIWTVILTSTVLHVFCDRESRITQTLISPAVILTDAIQAHVRIRAFIFVWKHNNLKWPPEKVIAS